MPCWVIQNYVNNTISVETKLFVATWHTCEAGLRLKQTFSMGGSGIGICCNHCGGTAKQNFPHWVNRFDSNTIFTHNWRKQLLWDCRSFHVSVHSFTPTPASSLYICCIFRNLLKCSKTMATPWLQMLSNWQSRRHFSAPCAINQLMGVLKAFVTALSVPHSSLIIEIVVATSRQTCLRS